MFSPDAKVVKTGSLRITNVCISVAERLDRAEVQG